MSHLVPPALPKPQASLPLLSLEVRCCSHRLPEEVLTSSFLRGCFKLVLTSITAFAHGVFFWWGGHTHGIWKFPGEGSKSELELLAYTQLTAMQDPSHVCDLHHSSRQCRILNPLNEASDQTQDLLVPGQICFCCATMGTP